MAYNSGMSAPPNVPVSPPRPRQRFARTRDFWERVSEGRRIDDLWGQVAAAATLPHRQAILLGVADEAFTGAARAAAGRAGYAGFLGAKHPCQCWIGSGLRSGV